ncbi:hypothetical protein R3P38DRAFT_2543213 [Favolaschia claudopus]|uniref:Transposase n=1 Tax=Favolaschia claudopus TaxID=2862362 RepID=A0AAW0AS07_9AGAR
MDNAGNCNTTAVCLPKYIPTFRGILARGRCFTHIIQLVAKVCFDLLRLRMVS